MGQYEISAYNRANNQCVRMNEAIEKCEAALADISGQIGVIEQSWKGDAGAAMVAKLNELKSALNTSIRTMQDAYAQMQQETATANYYLTESARHKEEAATHE